MSVGRNCNAEPGQIDRNAELMTESGSTKRINYHELTTRRDYAPGPPQNHVRPYPDELVILKARQHWAGMGDQQNGGAHIAEGGVRLFTLPLSPKGSVVEPHVQILAPQLCRYLEMTDKSKFAQQNWGHRRNPFRVVIPSSIRGRGQHDAPCEHSSQCGGNRIQPFL